MIDAVHAKNVALIKEASIEPSTGLTVLTGETGAGKTALLGALKLLIGERADSSQIREGSTELVIEGRVYTRGSLDQDHVIRRRLSQDGRSRVDIDGSMASVAELTNLVGAQVDLCGQHEHQRLLQSSTHVEILDAKPTEELLSAKEDYETAFVEAQNAQAEFERVHALVVAASARLDDAHFVFDRIAEVSPTHEEYEHLQEVLPRAEHAEALLTSVETARVALVGEDDQESSAIDGLLAAEQALSAASKLDESLATHLDSLETTRIELEDLAASLRSYRDSIELDPAELERLETRFANYQGLMRLDGPALEDVLSKQAEAQEILSAASDSETLLRDAQTRRDEAEAALAQAADKLDAARAGRAPELAQEINQQMARLEMGGASVEFDQERKPRKDWTAAGPSHVELMFSPGHNLSARPLKKIASGGELSRVMLALKVVLGDVDSVETLVFDEVDAGVGGATAVALAALVEELAKTHQVLVVTHLAQLAVCADKHYLVERTEDASGTPETQLTEISGKARVAEIARMLAGDKSEISLAHARELLAAHASTN